MGLGNGGDGGTGEERTVRGDKLMTECLFIGVHVLCVCVWASMLCAYVLLPTSLPSHITWRRAGAANSQQGYGRTEDWHRSD